MTTNANTYAAAFAILTGKDTTALCVWCLNAKDPHEKLIARRASYGDCTACPYSGRDMFVVVL